MQVFFKARDPEGAQLRDLSEHRVRFVMRRLGWLVRRVDVQLTDVNGPRGGVDKRCQLTLRSDSAATVVITSMAADWRSALEGALKRAARTLVRAWRRGRTQPRGRPLAIGLNG